MRILGVDPGSRLTGYGCVENCGAGLKHVTHGTLDLCGSKTSSLENRILLLHQGLSSIIAEFKPEVLALEKVFFAKNALSALKLGQARGAILLTGKIHSLQIFEYSATQVKQTVAGYGRADKEQVAKMIQLIIGKHVFKTWDASDGLALAICHVMQSRANTGSKQVVSKRRSLSLAEAVGAKLVNSRGLKR